MRAQKAPLSVADPVDERSLTIPNFCLAEDISLATYYNLRRRGLGPKESRDNDRTARKHFIWIFIILVFGIIGLVVIVTSLLL
jgi:hypothetical protein